MSEPSSKHLIALKKYFGHTAFRPFQWQIIRSLLEEKRDNCVIMATGYGKSLCYQFPPVFCNGVAIVVSPLISLMQDQILSMQVCNISACLLGSAQASKGTTMTNILNGMYRLVYVTPEWCSSEGGKSFISDIARKNILTLVAIDEAHCVSQWGFDFRKSYRSLHSLRTSLPHVPFLTVTATASSRVIDDICTSLKLRNPAIVKTSFDRPNLFLSVSVKGDDIVSDIKPLILGHGVKENKSFASTIIYCPTKKISDKVYDMLTASGFNCALYHADLSLKVRKDVHEEFVRDKVPIVIATVAFGMGIDKPDVRVVIHYGAPKEIESYYQEIGRAGRDGLPAVCHVFYSHSDFHLNRFFFGSLSGKHLEHKENMARLLEKYLQTRDCRRKLLLSYFDPKATFSKNPRCCDNCTQGITNENKSGLYDLTEDTILLLKAIEAFNGKYGLSVPIFMLRGSTNKRLPKDFHNHKLFCKGVYQPEAFWKCLGRLLLREGLLIEETSNFGRGWNKNAFPVSTIHLSDTGKQFLQQGNGDGIVELEPTSEIIRLVKPKAKFADDSWLSSSVLKRDYEKELETIDPILRKEKATELKIYQNLVALRQEIAEGLDCMPYMICSNKVLQELSAKKPLDISSLSDYDGFTETKINKFGSEIISCIKKNLEEENKDSTQVPESSVKKFQKSTHTVTKPKFSYVTETTRPVECSSAAESLSSSPIEEETFEGIGTTMMNTQDSSEYETAHESTPRSPNNIGEVKEDVWGDDDEYFNYIEEMNVDEEMREELNKTVIEDADHTITEEAWGTKVASDKKSVYETAAEESKHFDQTFVVEELRDIPCGMSQQFSEDQGLLKHPQSCSTSLRKQFMGEKTSEKRTLMFNDPDEYSSDNSYVPKSDVKKIKLLPNVGVNKKKTKKVVI